MEAIILAGGFGTRLKNIISELPKPMAPIRGIPFLSYILDQLERQGFTKIILAVGYLHEKISSYYGDNYKSIKIEYSIEDEPLGTGGCVKMAMKKTSDKHIFVINGDTYFDIDFSKITLPNNVLIACKKMEDTSRYGRVVINENTIVDFSEKGTGGSGYINGGIYCFNRDVFDKFDLPTKFSMEKDLFEKYLVELNIQTYLSNDYFIDIGIPDDYEKAQREL